MSFASSRRRDSFRFEQQNLALRSLYISIILRERRSTKVKGHGSQQKLGMQRISSRQKRRLPWFISMASAGASTDHRKTRVNLS